MKKSTVYLFICLFVYNNLNAQKKTIECVFDYELAMCMKNPSCRKSIIIGERRMWETGAYSYYRSGRRNWNYKISKDTNVLIRHAFSSRERDFVNHPPYRQYVSYQNLFNVNEKKENDKELKTITEKIITKEKDSVGIVLKVYVVGYNTDTSWNEEQFKKMITETQAVADKMIAYGLDKKLIQIIPYWIKPLVGYTDDRKKQIGIYILGN